MGDNAADDDKSVTNTTALYEAHNAAAFIKGERDADDDDGRVTTQKDDNDKCGMWGG